MAVTPLTTDLNHIQALDDRPNANSGMTADQVKEAFDQSGNDIKDYINNEMIPSLDATFETKTAITTDRKLSPTGDFTGTINGQTIIMSNPGLATAFAALSADVLQRGINVMYPPSPLVAAKCDGSTNDSVAIQAMITALVAAGGGKLIFPTDTITLCNINVVGNNVSIEGGGNSTILKPYSLLLPVLKIGDGTTQTYNTYLRSLSLQGDSTTATSDGFVIDGATYVNFSDFVSINFGRHNISLVSTGTEPTQYIYLSGFSSKRALGSCLNLNYGTKWVTAVYLSGAYIEGRNLTGATAVDLTGIVEVNMVDSWIQCGGSKQGHVRFNTSASYIRASNLNIDIDVGSTSTSVEVTSAKSLISNHITGSFSINGKVEYSDGTKFSGLNVVGAAPYHKHLSYPIIANGLVFGDVTLAVDVLQAGTETNTMELFNSNGTLFGYPKGTASGNQGAIFMGQSGTPATATSTGMRGQMMWDATYIYFCIATNTWARIARAAAW